MELDPVTGPALRTIRKDSDQDLQVLFAEQRGLLQVVRENRIWDWFGGLPSFGPASLAIHDLYLAFGFVGLTAIALVVAGLPGGSGCGSC